MLTLLINIKFDTNLKMRSTEDYPRPGDHGYVWDDTYGNFNNKEYRGLRLVWDESDANNKIEYNIRFNNTRRGFWVSSGPIGDSKSKLSCFINMFGRILIFFLIFIHSISLQPVCWYYSSYKSRP